MPYTNEVTFVYLGKKIPKYALSSMELARRYSGLRVRLITDAENLEKINTSKFEIVHVKEFYAPEIFANYSKVKSIPANFREGFWLKTLERFFVLEQFMRVSKSESLFHAELDQVLFRSDFLIEKIEKSDLQGLFFPFHVSNQPIASVFFCNDLESLRSLVDFCDLTTGFISDMQLLGLWAKNNEDRVKVLPTLASKIHSQEFKVNVPGELLTAQELNGIVDGAQIGQWVAGIDPRNVPIWKRPSNHFSEDIDKLLLKKEELENINFYFDENTKFLTINFNHDHPTNIYNLHLHSKIHNWLLRSNNPVAKLLEIANSKDAIFINRLRLIQIYSYIAETIASIKNLLRFN